MPADCEKRAGADGIGFTLLRFCTATWAGDRWTVRWPVVGPGQAADRLAAGSGYPETGLVLVDAPGAPIRPEAYSGQFAVLCPEAGLRKIDLNATESDAKPSSVITASKDIEGDFVVAKQAAKTREERQRLMNEMGTYRQEDVARGKRVPGGRIQMHAIIWPRWIDSMPARKTSEIKAE